MTKDEIEYAVIKNSIRNLCVMCAGSEDKVIDLMTGYLWDEKEAENIKKSDGKFDIVSDFSRHLSQVSERVKRIKQD